MDAKAGFTCPKLLEAETDRPLIDAGRRLIVLADHTKSGIEVRPAHPGGPVGAKRDEGVWSVPKGEIDEGEDPWAVARREFEEETGHLPPDGERVDLGEIQQKGGKIRGRLGSGG